MEVRPAEFARQAGVSRASISEKIKKKRLIVNAAGFLDTENPVNAAYLSKHKQKRAEADAAEQVKMGGGKSFTSETFTGNTARPDDFAVMRAAGLPAREMLNMTLREIVMKYPGIEKIERYAKILKDITMSAEKEQRIQERELASIPKDFVISRLFGFIDGLIKQLLEYPESSADRIIALANTESENTRIEVVDTMKNGISLIANNAKDTIIAELNGLKSKYQNEIKNYDRIEEIKDAIAEARNE